MKGTFRHVSGFEVEVESLEEDKNLISEIAIRKAFIEEAARRLDAVNLNEWSLVEISTV